jgi:hypothetical protein
MKLPLFLLASILATGSAPLLADSIPYGNAGHLAPDVTFTAAATGNVMGYFVSSDAGDNDEIELWDTTTNTFSGFLIPNHGSDAVAGFEADFGMVNQGDNLVFILNSNNGSGQNFDSVDNNGVASTYSADGYNHAYSTQYTGGLAGLPSGLTGTYVGMEDEPYGSSDLDYNDDTFVFTDIAATPTSVTPEPSSLILFGTGLLGVAGTLRRKLAR